MLKLSSHPETSAVPLVFAQRNAEGRRKKKPELQQFLKREGVDIICIQETQMLIASPLEGTSTSGMTEQIDTREE